MLYAEPERLSWFWITSATGTGQTGRSAVCRQQIMRPRPGTGLDSPLHKRSAAPREARDSRAGLAQPGLMITVDRVRQF